MPYKKHGSNSNPVYNRYMRRRSTYDQQLINFLQASLAGKISGYIVDRCIGMI